MRQMLWSLGNMHGTVSRTCKNKNSSYNQESERNCLLEDRKKKKKRKGRGKKEEKKKYK